MLERIREGSQGFWAKAILGLVILTFALAGVGSYLNAKTDVPVATVNGDDISQSSLENAYQNERARMENQYGEAFANLMADTEYMKTFKRGLLDRLIADKLVEQTAADLGMRVSDAQVKDALLAMPEFQVGGIFNNDRYQAILRQAGMQPQDFRERIRLDMTRQQLVSALLGSEFSLDSEVELVYALQQQQRDISYVMIFAKQFLDSVAVSEEDVSNYYQSNISNFDTEERVSLRYLELKVEDLMAGIDVSEQEINDAYQANMEQYRTAAERRASHILIEFGDDEQKAREQAEEVLKRAKSGEDFAALAKEFSADDFSAENGGDLDWFGRDVMDPAFEEATFALTQEGDISDVVESSFGLHIIKLTGVKAEEVQPLDAVKDEIVAQVKRDKAQAEFYQLHQQVAEMAFEQPDNLEDVAGLLGKEIQTSDMFSRAEAQGVFAGNQVLNVAFSDELIEEGVNSEVIDVTPDHLIVMRVAEHQPQRTRPLAEVSEEILAQLKADKAQSAAKQWADEVVSLSTSGEDIQSKLDEKALVWASEANQVRYGSLLPAAVVEQAFKLGMDAKMAAVNTADGNVAIVRLDAIHQAAKAEEAMLAGLEQRLTSGRSQQLYVDFIEALKEKADIEIHAVQ
ncbi:SurA N-terminal domain-containing protein [Bowmanella sp. Y26]|uniref:SurA N-terminal domain-containing protein n=1 Tax=Bowmanella yangjiangensis TaxID=2811230 RepID=UPI001BDD2B97|nr:SurA N-terminal domain-containing protein [Bowmanella yangjiangensis]MBT1065676.1 SurA N-terminal domain-containing protein [Bowmanella yangjiangensis]